ncbi:helix-turn-helix domain-containing protein [Mucilaginibacter lacusdianchii]|uniref:helix-turn-helix domain-containing protein n=1 Tax=Mucilaginibacter lacusdianchii TaxID=2684211 RepID=UPI00131D712A|nr:helix-turn-helix transcriptional regulator [Mucilaginibacter sp. JXJ CY 39]
MSDILLNEIYKMLDSGETTSFRELVEQKKKELAINSDLQLAKLTGIDKNTLPRIIDGETQKVDLFSLIKLCHFLGLDTTQVLQIYVASLKPEIIGDLDRARTANYILRNFDLQGLHKIGFIKSTTDFDAIEKRITTFFNLDSIFQYNSYIGAVAFSRTKILSSDKMREFWIRAAVFHFEKINNPNEYQKDILASLIPKIHPYTRYVEKGLQHVIQALYNIGVTVIVQGYLTKTQVRGGTFSINNKPCIVLTDYRNSYPHLWAALMHELFHVLYEFDLIKSTSYHLTGDPQSPMFPFNEEYAEIFSWDMLLPKDKREYVKHMIRSESTIASFAKDNMVHPGIIYAAYCEDLYAQPDKKSEFGLYQHFFGKSEKSINAIKYTPWQRENINEEVEEKKQSYNL